jgi:hypothetical protein
MDEPVLVTNGFRSIADGSTYTFNRADDGDTTLYSRVGQRVPVRELVERMITRSSNLATNLLIGRAGPRRIATTLAALGAGVMKVLRGVEDGPAFRAGMNNATTAYGLMRVMEAIAGGRAASRRSTDEMLAILGRQEFREMIPAGLPAGVRSANKTGNITRNRPRRRHRLSRRPRPVRAGRAHPRIRAGHRRRGHGARHLRRGVPPRRAALRVTLRRRGALPRSAPLRGRGHGRCSSTCAPRGPHRPAPPGG